MARYINCKNGNFYFFGSQLGSSLRCTILNIRFCHIDWVGGGNKIYDTDDMPIPAGASRGCDLTILLNGQEYVYTITGRSIELVLQPYLHLLEKQGKRVSEVTTLVSAEVVDGFNYLRLEK